MSEETIDYKINPALKDQYQDVHDITDIDFKRHTRSDIALAKSESLLPNGRPEFNEYRYNDELVARLRFEFTDENSLMKTRKEIINYVKNDGTYGPDILIKDRVYDHTNPSDGAICIAERVRSRSNIVGAIKAFLSGVLMQATQSSLEEVIDLVTPFWDLTERERLAFLEFGKSDWSDVISTMTPETSPFNYLFFPINAQGVTVQQYMLSRINY